MDACEWGAETNRFSAAAGLRILMRETGEGAPLLLINGIGAHVDMWTPLVQQLDSLRVIAYDAPGTGASSTPLLPMTLERLADLAARILDLAGVERADVLGYSFGGLVAQHLARRAPARVRRLVLAATTPGWGGVPGSLEAMLHLSTPLRYYVPSYYRAVAGRLMGGRARSDPEWVQHQSRHRSKRPPTVWGYGAQLAAIAMAPGSLPWLSELQHPTLVIAGSDDPLIPVANSHLLAHALPHARLSIVADQGHLLLFDAECDAGSTIHDFLTAEPLSASSSWNQASAVDRVALQQALDGLAPYLTHPLGQLSAVYRYLTDAQVKS